jgi:D-alanine-D-alanine ligase
MDKALFKDVMTAIMFPILPYQVFNRPQIEDDINAAWKQQNRLPTIRYSPNLPTWDHLSVSANAHQRSDLMEGLMEAARYDRRILVEKGWRIPERLR